MIHLIHLFQSVPENIGIYGRSLVGTATVLTSGDAVLDGIDSRVLLCRYGQSWRASSRQLFPCCRYPPMVDAGLCATQHSAYRRKLGTGYSSGKAVPEVRSKREFFLRCRAVVSKSNDCHETNDRICEAHARRIRHRARPVAAAQCAGVPLALSGRRRHLQLFAGDAALACALMPLSAASPVADAPEATLSRRADRAPAQRRPD